MSEEWAANLQVVSPRTSLERFIEVNVKPGVRRQFWDLDLARCKPPHKRSIDIHNEPSPRSPGRFVERNEPVNVLWREGRQYEARTFSHFLTQRLDKVFLRLTVAAKRAREVRAFHQQNIQRIRLCVTDECSRHSRLAPVQAQVAGIQQPFSIRFNQQGHAVESRMIHRPTCDRDVANPGWFCRQQYPLPIGVKFWLSGENRTRHEHFARALTTINRNPRPHPLKQAGVVAVSVRKQHSIYTWPGTEKSGHVRQVGGTACLTCPDFSVP